MTGEKKLAKPTTPEEAAGILSASNSVIIIPGYGMAVAQAQHKVRELYDQLTSHYGAQFTNTAYVAWRDKANTIEALAAWSLRTMTLSGAGDPERIRVAARR